jgi:hypothetical protein
MNAAYYELRLEESEAASIMGFGNCRIARTKISTMRASNCAFAQRSNSANASEAARPFL